MTIRRPRSLGAVALGARSEAVRAVEAAERSLAAIEREIGAARQRERELAAKDRGQPRGACPAALRESGALGRSADRAALAEVVARLRHLIEERERALRGLGAAQEALVRAIRAAELLSRPGRER